MRPPTFKIERRRLWDKSWGRLVFKAPTMNLMKSRLAGWKEPKQVSRSSEKMNGFAKGLLFSLATEVE